MMEVLASVGEFGERGFGYGIGWIFPLLFWVLLLVGIFWLVRRKQDWREWHGVRSGEAVLAERYAKGEITEEEYRQRKQVLREGQARR